METLKIKQLLQQQRNAFRANETLDVSIRIERLKQLKQAILAFEDEISEALYQDLGKSRTESYMCEIGLTLSELNYFIQHTHRFAKAKKVKTPLSQLGAKSIRQPTPYGNVLIMSPWNYPFMLSMIPLVEAIAAGNTVLLKPSAYSPRTSAIIEKIILSVFDPKIVAVVQGGREENQALLDQKFDFIFFTGSTSVGRTVMEKASRFLTPIVLELGGKSPCIVDETADLKLAARRIVFGKFLNVGQTCVAPDYVWVHQSVEKQLIELMNDEIKKQIPTLEAMGKIINQKHFERLCALIEPQKVLLGGKCDKESCKIEATLVRSSFEDKIMEEEIFGPILPILTFETLDECITTLHQKPLPLALYFFSQSSSRQQDIMNCVRFGGGCINDTIVHLASTSLPFGGVGESGMGSYHGKVGFETFSHTKSVLKQTTRFDLPMRYPPFTSWKEKLIRFFLK